MITYSHKIYPALSPFLSIFERKIKKVDELRHHKANDHDIILFGYNRMGFDILESLKKIKRRFLVVDYDPETIALLSREGYDCRYGDGNDAELLNELNFQKATMVISTIPLADTNLLIIHKVKKSNPQAIIAVVAHQIDDALQLYDEGATYVILPHFLGGRHFSTMIEDSHLSIEHFLREKIAHLKLIARRKTLGHEHPQHEHR